MKKLFTTALAAVMLLGGTLVSARLSKQNCRGNNSCWSRGGTDVTARMMMLRARRVLGEDMVVVNKRGGGGCAVDYYLERQLMVIQF